METRYRDLFAKHVLSILSLSDQPNPKSALIVRGGVQLGSGFSKSTGTFIDTSPITEAICMYYAMRSSCDNIEETSLFCTYFPSLEEFRSIFITDIRLIYYMGEITDAETVKFLNTCSGKSFKIIQLQFD